MSRSMIGSVLVVALLAMPLFGDAKSLVPPKQAELLRLLNQPLITFEEEVKGEAGEVLRLLAARAKATLIIDELAFSKMSRNDGPMANLQVTLPPVKAATLRSVLNQVAAQLEGSLFVDDSGIVFIPKEQALTREVAVNVKDVPVKEALEAVVSVADIGVVFPTEGANPKVTMSARGVPIQDAVAALVAAAGLKCNLVGNAFVITDK